jgi:integral membrane protein
VSDEVPSDRRPIPAGLPGQFGFQQPALTDDRVAGARKNLAVYRFMAFLTGVVLLAGTIALILKYAAGVDFGAVYGILWVAHGWLFVIYVIVTGLLGVKLRWPLGRYLLVMLAGTVPTCSFFAEHKVTSAVRASVQPASVRD